MTDPSRRVKRSSFNSSVRALFFFVIIISAFVTLPLRHHGSTKINDEPAAGSRVADPAVEVVGDDTSAAAAHVNSAPMETLPELHFVFPAEAVLDSLFTSGDKVLNQTHVFPQMHRPEVVNAPEARFHNPYKPMKVGTRKCVNGAHASGRWVYDEALQPRYPSYGEILGCCQRGFEKEFGSSAVRPELKYRWESDGCDLLEWSEELFCKALRGRDIMIAGDSLNDHWHASLYYLLGGRKDIYKREGTVRGKRACGTHEICRQYYPKPLRLYFLTNQLLQEERRLFRNYKWWKYIRGYPILVLNSGSWMRDPADESRVVSDDEYFKHMIKAFAIVRKLYNGTVIWRTTYQGHPYCWNYKKPLTQELQAHEFPRVPPYLRYRWWAIPYRNNFTVQLWRQGGAHILDVTRITNLMPLGHLSRYHPKYAVRNVTDCLHYCSPGPVYDTWSRLLMNLLLGNLE